MIGKMFRKAKFICLLDTYEKNIKAKGGRKKESYIGEEGYLIKKISIQNKGHTIFLYDMKFKDGQTWCVEEDQIIYLKED